MGSSDRSRNQDQNDDDRKNRLPAGAHPAGVSKRPLTPRERRRKKRDGIEEEPGEKTPLLLAPWQRGLIWAAWLAWIVRMVWNSDSAFMGVSEFGLLALAIAVSILCSIYRCGRPAVFITGPEQMPGNEFVSRTNWAFVLGGVALMIGGVAGGMKIIEDLSSGFTTVGGIFTDTFHFLLGWFMEIITGGWWDGEVEKTRGYIFIVMLPIGLLMSWIALLPLIHRGCVFRVETDDALFYQRNNAWHLLHDTDFAEITADAVEFMFYVEPAPGPPPAAASSGPSAANPVPPPPSRTAALTLPQGRVFASNLGTRVKDHVLAAYFRRRLEKLGYTVERRTVKGMVETQWRALRPKDAVVRDPALAEFDRSAAPSA